MIQRVLRSRDQESSSARAATELELSYEWLDKQRHFHSHAVKTGQDHNDCGGRYSRTGRELFSECFKGLGSSFEIQRDNQKKKEKNEILIGTVANDLLWVTFIHFQTINKRVSNNVFWLINPGGIGQFRPALVNSLCQFSEYSLGNGVRESLTVTVA